MDNAVFEIRFSSEINLTKNAVNDVLKFIDDRMPAFSNNLRTDIRLVFQELLINSVVHGNKRDAKKQVFLRVEIENDTIKARIADEGLGFDYKRLLNELDNTDMLALDHGRGLKLVCSLTDSLSFNKEGNEIFFNKKVVYYE